MTKITKDYIINTHYNGIHPTCKCGCGTLLSFKPLKNGPWFPEYTRNHAPKKQHSELTKKKISEGCKNTARIKYGVENPFQSTEVKNKIKESNLRKYGVENYAQTDEWRAKAKTLRHSDDTKLKIKNTNQLRYGANSFTATLAGRQVLRNIGFLNYYGSWDMYMFKLKNNNITCITSNETFIDNPHTPLTFQCDLCQNTWEEISLLMPICTSCKLQFEQSGRSQLESSLFSWLDTLGIPFKTNKVFTNSRGKKYSLDVYLEDYNLGIEMNGLWWHSENHGQKDRHYHQDKLLFFNEKNIRVLNIFEDEWNTQRKIIQSKILHVLKKSNTPKIYARQCIVREIPYNETVDFLEQNHIQGHIKSGIYLGAFYNTTLVAVMTFSKNNRLTFNKSRVSSHEYELVRFATNIEYTVVGVMGKLLTHFIHTHQPSKIISYADRRFTSSDHNVYVKNNFILQTITRPNYFYVRGSRRYNRLKFTKQKLIKEGYSSNLTEWEIMKNIGYDRIWDCGHLKYELRVV
jgi:hypothetical protein